MSANMLVFNEDSAAAGRRILFGSSPLLSMKSGRCVFVTSSDWMENVQTEIM